MLLNGVEFLFENENHDNLWYCKKYNYQVDWILCDYCSEHSFVKISLH